MSKFIPLIAGSLEIAAGVVLGIVSGFAATPLAGMLIVAGAGTVIGGLGTLLAKGAVKGFATVERNPTASWRTVYGRARVGGTSVYEHQWPQPGNGSGGNDQILDLVTVLAAHQCQSVDVLLFDKQRVQIDATTGTCSTNGTAVTWTGGLQQFSSGGAFAGGFRTGRMIQINGVNYTVASFNSATSLTLTASAGVQTNVGYMGGGSAPSGALPGSGVSFTPVQTTVKYSASGPCYSTQIQRVNGVVTVTLAQNIPYLIVGDRVKLTNVPGDLTLNGTFQVEQILSQTFGSPGSITFTFLSGGTNSNVLNAGWVTTLWADYGRTVYFELLLAGQALGETFAGMTYGTPLDGNIDGILVGPNSIGTLQGAPEPNPWTNYCSLQGKTAVFLRIHPNTQYYPAGLPQISHLIHGKNNIADYRTSPPTVGYTENAALCIADFLSTSMTGPESGGYGANYGTDIPIANLNAAANVCDEVVSLAYGGSPPATEPAYACNGQFTLDVKRGEILKNMLTSCAGRITDFGGQLIIWPAAYTGVSFGIGCNPGGGAAVLPAFSQIAAGPIGWKPTVSIRDLYNGVKGTYISQANNWEPGDFPPYCQDSLHGYSGPSLYDGDANLAADGGDRRWLDVQFPFTISPSAVQRMAKIELLRRRHFGTGTLTLNMYAYQLTPLDIGQITLPFLNWTEKQLEVTAVRLRMDEGRGGKGPALVVELDVQENDASIYEWSTTEELSPEGYIQPQIGSYEFLATETVPGFDYPYPWEPGYVAPLQGDALFPGAGSGTPPVTEDQASFGLAAEYGTDAMGNATAQLQIQGAPPINQLSAVVGAPQISCVVGTAGSLAPGTYVVAATAFDTQSPYHNSIFSTPVIVTIPASSPPANNGSIAVTVAWPSGANGGDLYMAAVEAGNGFTFQVHLSAAATSATITAFDQASAGGPDVSFDHFAVAWKRVIHGGVWAQQVQAVTPTTITIAGGGMTLNQWAGYTLTLLGKLDSTLELPILNMPVASNTASTGSPSEFVLTIGPNAASEQLPDLTGLLVPGDLVVMRFNAKFTPTSFYDPNISNPYYPGGATDTNVEPGHLVRVMSGVDKGDVQVVASIATDGSGNDTIIELAGPWAIQPNPGDIVIIEDAIWGAEQHFPSSIPNKTALPAGAVIAAPFVQNLAGQTWLIIVRTQNVNDDNGPDDVAPVREMYFFGSQGTRTISTSQTMLATDRIVDVNAAGGNVIYTLLPFATIPNQSLFLQKVDGSANAVQWVCAAGDTVNGQSNGLLENEWDSITIVVSGD